MMRFYIVLASLVLSGICVIQIASADGSNWKSGPPDGLPELNKLSVACGKEEMTIHLEFTAPYDGSVYSKSNGQSQRCIHVVPHSQIKETTFSINYHSCGTRSDSQGKYYENTIIIQYDDIVIEAWDEAKKIRCEWHDGYEKSAYKMPITISDLDVVEMNFQGDDVDCWLEVQDGKGPWSAKVDGLVPLGSPLTLVVAIQDSEGQFDMRVKSCIAHDGQKHPIHLTDEDGCVLRPKMMSPFQKTSDTKGTASVIAYSHFYAFKFPETVEVTIQCTVEICRHGCPDTCLQGRDAQTPETGVGYLAPQSKEQEDIPTYKDSHPFSTVITSKPGKFNSSLNASSSILNVQTNVSKDDEPLKTSPDTHHDFYMNRFPYDLYDLFEAEDRQDKNEQELYTNVEDNEYLENRDNIYFSQIPNVFTAENEQGKNFPLNQKIQNISSDAESTTKQPEILGPLKNTTSNVTGEDNASSIQKFSIAEKFTDIKESEKLSQKESNETDSLESTDFSENPISDEPIMSNSESHVYAKTSQEHILDQLFSSELFEDDDIDLDTEKTPEDISHETNTRLITESLHEPTIIDTNKEQLHEPTIIDTNKEQLYEPTIIDTNKEQLHEPTIIDTNKEQLHEPTITHANTETHHESHSNDADVEIIDELNKHQHGEKRTLNRDTTGKKFMETSFEDYKIKARKPLDNLELQHNLHDFNYRPFMPPAPVPPLTLYNGVPLYYYSHPNTNVEFLERDGFQYVGRHPYQKEYVKSKLRRPGRRRQRREIGENEQLGLKQTLRVVASTDFEFLVKENEKIKPLYVGKSELDNEVCIAPSSFAAGLGLLLLANICVLCVVVFLGHHYYIHRNMKAKNTELLCTEMT